MWSGQAPTCQRQGERIQYALSVAMMLLQMHNVMSCIHGNIVVDCGQLQNPENGFVQVSSTTEGSTATYTCNQGFQLVGNRQRTCQNNGQWSGQQPSCQRRSTTLQLMN